MWGNTTHPIYCAIKSSSLGSGTLKINVHKGSSKDGDVWFRTTMEKMPTTIHKAATGETKDLYYGMIEYVEEGLQEIQFEIWDGDDKREWHSAFSGWWTSDGYTKPVYDYENKNFTTYPASLSEKTSYVYFNAADWTDAYIQLGVGHGLYQGYNQLSPLTNTTLYYGNPSLNYGDAVHITFLGHYENFGTGNNWLTDLTSHASHYAGFLHYSLVENNFYYFSRNSGDANGTALSYSHLGSESTSYQSLNKTQTVQARVKATGSSYSDAAFASWPGSVSVARTYMSSASATSTPDAANMSSATTSAVITSSITLTASANSGYYFEGWGDASNSNPTDGTAAKTYTITDAKTSYAFFSQTYTLTYERKGDYSTSTVTCYSVADYTGAKTSGSSIPTGHMITIVATPATGYEVKGWYSDASCTSPYTSGSGGVTIESGNNTFKLASLNADTEVYPKFGPKTYTITLEDMEPSTAGQGSVSVTYNASTNMTASDEVTKPTKNNYDFGGYWVRDEETKDLVTQLIDADGKWIADKTGYTSHDGSDNPTWVHDYAISLFAKWTETAYTITPSVTPAGAGSVNTVTDAHIITASSTITATPANAAWIFDYWEYGTHVGKAGGDGNAITVTSDMNSTITAHFKPRYELVGSYWDDSSDKRGMPGWTYDGTGEFTYNGFTALGTGTGTGCDLLHSCALDKNTTYIFQIHDRVTGNHGNATVEYFGEGDTLLFNTKDRNVTLAATGAGTYTFRIINITEGVNDYYPTVTIERPHQVFFGQKYLDIDGTLREGTTGGSASVKVGETAKTSGDYVNYNTSVTHDIDEVTGYHFAGWWGSDEYEGARFSNVHPMTYAVTSDDHAFAKFTEDSTHVHFANDGHGHVEIGGVTRTDTIVGITTHRKIVGVPDVGYKFSSWDKTSGSDYDIDGLSSDTATLSGNGGGATSGQTVTANFTYRWALKAESDGWGAESFTIENISTDDSGDVVGYVEIDLAANTNYQFKIIDLQTNDIYKNNNVAVQYMTYTNHTNWDFATTYTYNCGITTAGKGSYRFTWNITDKTMTVTYPTSYQVNYGASVGGSVTSVLDGDENAVPNGGYVVAGGSVTYTAAAASGYTFVGWCNSDSYGDTFTNLNPWTNSSIAATSNAYAKFKSTNFVIYRSGDMSSDPRAAYDDVESYAGGTISEKIEYRMKVHELDKWYTLCLPFALDSVGVWDESAGVYYDLVPYYRTSVGGTLNGGHYIIRTPNFSSGNSIAIANFDDWRDPETTDWLPSANKPYIIQWHMSYFQGKYVSFFGASGQTISSFSAGSAPGTDDVVNVYGNNSMQTGSVTGAYMLDADYGSGGAWLRLDNASTSRAILPFECYIRASETITGKYKVIRHGMNIDNTTTDFFPVTDNPSSVTEKVLIGNQIYILRGDRLYTIQGTLVKEGE